MNCNLDQRSIEIAVKIIDSYKLQIEYCHYEENLNVMTAREKNRIKKQIKEDEAYLKSEKQEFGGYFDYEGRRYMIAELYIDIEAYADVLKYYEWFNKEFPDDIGYPELHLCWVIAGIKEGNMKVTNKHLVYLEEINTYIVPKLLGIKPIKIEKWEGMNLSEEEYADYLLERSEKWIDKEVLSYLELTSGKEIYREFKSQVIKCDIELNREKNPKVRGEIDERRNQFIEAWIQAIKE